MTFTDTPTNGSSSAPVQGETSAFGVPRRDVPALPDRGARPALAVLAIVGLLGVFFAAYAIGRDAGGRSLPAHKTSTSSTGKTPGSSAFTPPTDLTPSTGFTPSTGLTSIPGLFFTFTNADLTGQGCDGEITFTWTFDPAKTPPAGSDAVIQVTGPNSSDTRHASPASGALKLTVPVSLDTAGEWTAVVQSVDGQPALPQPIAMTLAGNCF